MATSEVAHSRGDEPQTRPSASYGPLRLSWNRFWRLRLALHAEAALCPLADHHHRADDPAAIGRRLRLHGAPLADGDAAPVGGGRPRHRRDHRHDRDLSARCRLRQHHPHRAGPAVAQGRHHAARSAAAARAQAVLLDPRRCAVGRDHPPDQPAVLDRHGRQFQHRRDPHPARRTRCCGSSRAAARPMPPTPTSSCSGWSAPRWCC